MSQVEQEKPSWLKSFDEAVRSLIESRRDRTPAQSLIDNLAEHEIACLKVLEPEESLPIIKCGIVKGWVVRTHTNSLMVAVSSFQLSATPADYGTWAKMLGRTPYRPSEDLSAWIKKPLMGDDL